MNDEPNAEPLWINGVSGDFSTARVSVEDRGFVFGDGVYEVVRVYDGAPFLMDEHLARLRRSLAGVEIKLPMTDAELAGVAGELVARSGLSDAEIYMQVTRGVARRDHVWDDAIAPTVLIGVRRGREVPVELYETGCRVITLTDERWAHCDLKTLNLLPNVLAKKRAARVGALEALLVRDGLLMEGATSNVFVVRGGVAFTPVADCRILSGVTRRATIRVARACGYQVCEEDIPVDALAAADEVFLTSTSVELMPVTQVDGRAVGTGQPGAAQQKLHQAFRLLYAKTPHR